MLRLLWKEFHEVKWYLLGFLTLPWVVILWGLVPVLSIGFLVWVHRAGGLKESDTKRVQYLAQKW